VDTSQSICLQNKDSTGSTSSVKESQAGAGSHPLYGPWLMSIMVPGTPAMASLELQLLGGTLGRVSPRSTGKRLYGVEQPRRRWLEPYPHRRHLQSVGFTGFRSRLFAGSGRGANLAGPPHHDNFTTLRPGRRGTGSLATSKDNSTNCFRSEAILMLVLHNRMLEASYSSCSTP